MYERVVYPFLFYPRWVLYVHEHAHVQQRSYGRRGVGDFFTTTLLILTGSC